ncbi:MAG TPA: hypothetical protein VHP81_06370 [Lachnospiraceae bacterium]|nr:hypothetical protein [Lachnospiraceae bacterium]
MRKLARVIVMVSLLTVMLCACGKKVECDFCGEVKSCTEKSLFGEKIYVCDDCIDEFNAEMGN